MFAKKKNVKEELASSVDRRQYIRMREELEQERLRAEEERIRQEEIEKERQLAEQLRLEEEERQRVEREEKLRKEQEKAQLKAEQERLAKEEAERLALIEEERLMEQKRLEEEAIRLKQEEERIRLEEEAKARREEEARLLAERQKQEAMEREKAEQLRLEKERQEQERLAMEELLEQERLAKEAELLEQKRLAEEQSRLEEEKNLSDNKPETIGIPLNPQELKGKNEEPTFDAEEATKKPSIFSKLFGNNEEKQLKRDLQKELKNKQKQDEENFKEAELKKQQLLKEEQEKAEALRLEKLEKEKAEQELVRLQLEQEHAEQLAKELEEQEKWASEFSLAEEDKETPNLMTEVVVNLEDIASSKPTYHANKPIEIVENLVEVVSKENVSNVILEPHFENLPFQKVDLNTRIKYKPSKLKADNDKFAKANIEHWKVFDKITEFENKYNVSSSELGSLKNTIEKEVFTEWQGLLASKQVIEKECVSMQFGHKVIPSFLYAPEMKKGVYSPSNIGDTKPIGHLDITSDVQYKVKHFNEIVSIQMDAVFNFDSLIEVNDVDGKHVLSSSLMSENLVKELLYYLQVDALREYILDIDWSNFVSEIITYNTTKLAHNKLHLNYQLNIDKKVGITNLTNELKNINALFAKLSKMKNVDYSSLLFVNARYKKVMKKKELVDNARKDIQSFFETHQLIERNAIEFVQKLAVKDVVLLHQELTLMYEQAIKDVFPIRFNEKAYMELKEMFDDRVMFVSDRHNFKVEYSLTELSLLYKDLVEFSAYIKKSA